MTQLRNHCDIAAGLFRVPSQSFASSERVICMKVDETHSNLKTFLRTFRSSLYYVGSVFQSQWVWYAHLFDGDFGRKAVCYLVPVGGWVKNCHKWTTEAEGPEQWEGLRTSQLGEIVAEARKVQEVQHAHVICAWKLDPMIGICYVCLFATADHH